MKKLEDSTEEFKHQTIDRSLSKAIQQARLAKKMTQKELATAINERPQIIQQYGKFSTKLKYNISDYLLTNIIIYSCNRGRHCSSKSSAIE